MDMLEGESQLPPLSSDFRTPAIHMHAKIIIIPKYKITKDGGYQLLLSEEIQAETKLKDHFELNIV